MTDWGRAAWVLEVGGLGRRLIARIPAPLMIVAALGGSWWLESVEQAGDPRSFTQAAGHVAAARRTGRIAWLVEPGRRISSGEMVAKLEGGEPSAEVRSPVGGSVRAVLKKLGDVVAAGEAVVIVAAE